MIQSLSARTALHPQKVGRNSSAVTLLQSQKQLGEIYRSHSRQMKNVVVSAFANRMLRRIFEHKKKVVKQGWRKLHKESLTF
jgi:hypothetical protein